MVMILPGGREVNTRQREFARGCVTVMGNTTEKHEVEELNV